MERQSVHQTRMAEHALAPQETEQDFGGKTMAPPPFQLMASDAGTPDTPPEAPKNNTGLPDDLKAGMESMSGLSMDDVQVHRNSAEPGKMGAHAFAQGSDIHVAAGQEQHLPHEAWHVVQQKQGRVQATTEIGGNAVNDDVFLEKEADTMGAKALQMKADPAAMPLQAAARGGAKKPLQGKFMGAPVAQLANDKTQGNIQYITEDFKYLDEKMPRERTSKVILSGFNPQNHDKPNDPISFHSVDTGKWDSMNGLHRGHVAAAQFGGWYASYNIVPMLANFNTGRYAQLERKIAGELQAGHKVTISLDYDDDADARFPSMFTVASSSQNITWMDHSVPPREGTTDEYAQRLNDTFADEGSREHGLAELAKAAEAKKIPANYLKSPYLKLDIEWLAGSGIGAPMFFKSFESWQVDWIIRYNTRLNNGTMESDAWMGANGKEPHQILSESGRGNRPEVDHIVPNSRGGANFFVNARLVSWELNNKIERVKDANDKEMKW